MPTLSNQIIRQKCVHASFCTDLLAKNPPPEVSYFLTETIPHCGGRPIAQTRIPSLTCVGALWGKALDDRIIFLDGNSKQ